MGKSSSQKASVVDYRLSLHLGVCTAVDKILGITIDDKLAWDGDVSSNQEIVINKPDLFGGDLKEGGAVGAVTVLLGGPTQTLPEYIAQKLGLTTATAPGFRGITSLWFHGGTINPTDSPSLYAKMGFLWTKNRPFVAQKIWVKLSRKPVTALNSAYAWVTSDTVNPAHIVYEVLTNRMWGMGAPSTAMDIDSFESAAIKLYNEGLGLAILWTRSTTIEEFIQEVVNHIQATFFHNPATGKLTLKLIRDDYDVGDLKVFDPDNAEMSDFSRKLWGETVNEMTVSWTNPENEETETVTLQDISNVAAQGQVVSDSRNYYGVRSKELATELCARDLRSASAPLCSCSLKVNRKGWNLVPGDVVLVTWPEHELETTPMRIAAIDYGKKKSGKITLKLAEDIFALDHGVYSAPPSTEWQNPAAAPTLLDVTQTMSIPYNFASSTDFQGNPIELTYPETLGMLLGYEPDQDTLNYDLMSRALMPNGTLAYREVGTKDIVDKSVTSIYMSANYNLLPASDISRPDKAPVPGGFILFGDGNDYNTELAYVIDVDSDWITLSRGVLDTVPRAWPSGTRIWFLNPGMRIVDDATIRSHSEVAYYKLLPRTSLGRMDESSAFPIAATLIARPHFPLRPANVRVNGNIYVDSVNVSTVSDIIISWSNRNREFEDGQVLDWTAGSVTPEYGQHTYIQFYDISTGSNLYLLQGLYLETSVTIPKSYFARYASVGMFIGSRLGQTDKWSIQGIRLNITGLDNNPAAPAPPAPPAIGSPPNVTTEPDPSDFALVSGPISSGGVLTPCITVTGTPDSPDDVTGMLIRYRRNVLPVDWRYYGQLSVAEGSTGKIDITSVAASTTYEVQVAYVGEGQYPSTWVSLGTVNSGSSVSSAITGQGPLATSGLAESAVNNALITFGDNQIVNSNFAKGKYGWLTISTSEDGRPLLSDVETSGPFAGQRYVARTTVTTAGAAWPTSYPANRAEAWISRGVFGGGVLTDLRQFGMPVMPGDTVYAAAHMAVHRCQGHVMILLSDGTGTLVETAEWAGGRVYGGGSGNPDNFDRIGGIYVVANASARYMQIMVRMTPTDEADPYVFFTQPMMGKLAAGTTLLPAYTDGPADPKADVTIENTAAAIVGQGQLALQNTATWGTQVSGRPTNIAELTGTEGIKNTLVPLGKNELVNSDFTNGDVGWTLGWSGNSGLPHVGGRNGPDPGWYGVRNNRWSHLTGTPASGTVFDIAFSGPDSSAANVRRYAVPVKEGERLFVSCMAAMHRADRIECIIIWFDSNANALSETYSPGGGRYNGAAAANGDPSNFDRIGTFANVPYGARYAMVNFRCYNNGETEPYAWIIEPMLCHVSADQVTWPAYNSGPVDRLADKTQENTAAAIVGQGSLATQSQADWASQVTGAAKPENNATKSVVYRQTSSPSGASLNDIWVQLDGVGNTLAVYAWNGSSWIKGADITLFNTASSIVGQGTLATQSQADWASQVTGVSKPEDNATKSLVYRQSSTPGGASLNDIWIQLDGIGNTLAVYAWNGSSWIKGADITLFNTAAAFVGQGALATLNNANWATNVTGVGKPEDFANKSVVYKQASAPSSPSVNDIWIKLDGGGTAIGVAAWNGSTWITGGDITQFNVAAAFVGQGTMATQNGNNISVTGGAININNKFIVYSDGTTIIRSGTSGQRLVMTDSLISIYDSSNNLRVRMGIW